MTSIIINHVTENYKHLGRVFITNWGAFTQFVIKTDPPHPTDII